MLNLFTKPDAKTVSLKQMNPKEVLALLAQDETILVLDVRSPEEYAQDGHIAGSRLMPLPVIPVRSNELPQDKTIVCVCRSGARSQAACEALQKQGFTQLINMQGGMMAWKRAGLTTS